MSGLTALQKVEEIPLLKLFCDANTQGQAEAVVRVRWCLSAELVKIIREREFKKPQLMIVVRQWQKDLRGDSDSDGYKDQQVYVVPLEREMEFINIYSPGAKQIVANIVETKDSYVRDFVIDIQARTNGRGRSAFNVDGSVPTDENRGPGTEPWRESIPFIDTKAIIELEVDADCFAKEPPKAAKWLVGNYFEGKGRDQCHFRKRFLLSLFFAPLTVAILWPLRIIGLLFSLWVGWRDINWRALLPLEMAFPVDLDDKSSRWFVKDSDYSYHEPGRSLGGSSIRRCSLWYRCSSLCCSACQSTTTTAIRRIRWWPLVSGIRCCWFGAVCWQSSPSTG